MAADDVPGPKGQPRFKGTGAPATAADLGIVSDYAALVGNRRVGSTSERTTATSAGLVWPGLVWRDTDLKVELIYDTATGWTVLLEDTGWIDLTLANGWVNFGELYATAQIRRINRVVYTQGLLKNADGSKAAIGVRITTVPVGFRPLSAIQQVVWANGQAKQLDILGKGNVVVGDTPVSEARTSFNMCWPQGA